MFDASHSVRFQDLERTDIFQDRLRRKVKSWKEKGLSHELSKLSEKVIAFLLRIQREEGQK